MSVMRFIDLFAGLGGFHLALKRLGHECVFACEKNNQLADLYEINYGMSAKGDIQNIRVEDIPPHDILCAGFHFLKLHKLVYDIYFINDVSRIIKYHRPTYVILENVPHLRRHDREKTWETIEKKLKDELNYHLNDFIISPHYFGIPQIRKRLFIVGSTENIDYFNPDNLKKMYGEPNTNIKTVLSKNPSEAIKLNEKQIKCLDVWQTILNEIPKEDKLPTFPIWSMEFGATYPFEDKTPFICDRKELGEYKGIYGIHLKGLDRETQFSYLPRYARTEEQKFPEWKQEFIRKNREFYSKYKDILVPCIEDLKQFHPSWQKFEWNCQDGERIIKKYLIQFRPSGIRVKKINYAPSIVANTTHRPIIGWEERYMTIKEISKLQSMDGIKLPAKESTAYRALGNAVNVEVVYKICQKFLK